MLTKNSDINNYEFLYKLWDKEKNALSFDCISVDYRFNYYWNCSKCGYHWEEKLTKLLINPKCPCCELEKNTLTIIDLKGVYEIKVFYDYEKNDSKNGFENLFRWYYCPCCRSSILTEYPLNEFKFHSDGILVHKASKCKNKISETIENINYTILKKYNILSDIYSNEANTISLQEITFHTNHTKSYFWKCRDCMRIQLFTVRDIINGLNNNNLVCQFDKTDNFFKKSSPYFIPCSTCFQKYDASEYAICPYCSFVLFKKGVNSIDNYVRGIKKLWLDSHNGPIENYWFKSPEFNSKKFYWKCTNCKTFFTSTLYDQAMNSIYNRSGCKFGCVLVSKKRSDYLTLDIFRPDLASEWDSQRNAEPYNRSWLHGLAAFSWFCNNCYCNYSISPLDKLKGQGCIICENLEIKSGVNTLDIMKPKLIEEWDSSNNIDFKKITITDLRRVKWSCNECGTNYIESIKNRSKFMITCPKCREKYTLLDIKTEAALIEKDSKLIDSLYDKYPDLDIEWDYLKNNLYNITPKTVKIGDNSRVYWKCPEHEHIYQMSIKQRVSFFIKSSNFNPCLYCNDKLILPGFNSFADKYPKLLNEVHRINDLDSNSNPEINFPSSLRKIWWICMNNPQHVYHKSYKDRVLDEERNLEPCTICKGNRRKKSRFIIK